MQNLKDRILFFLTSQKGMLTFGLIGAYLVSFGLSFLLFTTLAKGGPTTPLESLGEDGLKKARSGIGEGQPKDSECPINGAYYTKAEKEIWDSRRPITAVIENHADSRPSSGLSYADVVYEAVAEGGITRFLGVFYCGVSKEEVKIAPVRSARIYFVNYAQEYGNKPVFMHVGGANDYSGSGDTVRDARALEYLGSIGWRVARGNDLDTTYDSGYPVFWRNYERLDHPVATEHTMMAALDSAFSEAEKRGFGAKDEDGNVWSEGFTPWKFTSDTPLSSPTNTEISFSFWEGKPEYDVSWKYDTTGNFYLRENSGVKYIDLETNTQIVAKNVVILFAKEKGPVDRNAHMLYTTIGKGDALVFQNGGRVEAAWEKTKAGGRTRFYDKKGKEIPLVRGATWIEVVPVGNEVKY